MSDGIEGQNAGGAGAAELGGGGGGAGAGAGGAPPEWLGGLPDDLRGDATLSRYQTVEALARGHIETKRLASSRLAVPAADAPPEAWGQVFDALGRPKDAAGYEIPLPKGQGASPLADAFKPVAHGLGLLPGQAKGVAEFFNAQAAAAEEAHYGKGEQEVGALKAELGPEYEAKLAAAKAVYQRLGLPAEFAEELDTKVGSGALVRGFIKLAELTGEHGRVDGGGGGLGGGGTANAAGQLSELYKDKSWRDRLNAGDAATVAQHNRLMEAAKTQAARKPG